MTGTLAAGAHPGSYNGQDAYSDMLIPYSVGPLTTGSPQRIRGTETSDSGHIIAVEQATGVDTYNQTSDDTTFQTMTGSRTDHVPHVMEQPNLAVRRLTPTECERLMGWPDNHTLHRADGKPNSDSTRYRMCGNGVVAPVAQWIAKHLKPLL